MRYDEIITICNEIKTEYNNIKNGTSTYTCSYSDMDGKIRDYKSPDAKNLLRIFSTDWNTNTGMNHCSFIYESFSTIHLDPEATVFHLGDEKTTDCAIISNAEEFFQYSTIMSYKVLLLSTIVTEFKEFNHSINISGSFVRRLLCEKL